MTGAADSVMPQTWRPLIHEAGIASHLVGAGLTELRKANYATPERYYFAFFGLSTGLERLMKLIVLVWLVIQSDGQFPAANTFKRDYGHDIVKLFQRIEEIRVELARSSPSAQLRWPPPERPFVDGVVRFLSDFAISTRYYNLDLLTGLARTGTTVEDPLARWMRDLGSPILATHYTAAQARTDEDAAKAAQALLEQFTVVRHHAEDGSLLANVADAYVAEEKASIVRRVGTFKCALLVRYLADLLFVVTYESFKLPSRPIPHLYEFFVLFLNSDEYLRRRKSFLRRS